MVHGKYLNFLGSYVYCLIYQVILYACGCTTSLETCSPYAMLAGYMPECCFLHMMKQKPFTSI